MVAEAYLLPLPTADPGTWALMSPAQVMSPTPGFPRPQSGGEAPRVLPWAHHVHIHDASREW